MRVLHFAGLACLVAVFSFAMPVNRAAAANQYLTVSGAACKPAGTSTNPSFISRATGARNESTTTGIFVICPFNLAAVPADGGAVIGINMTVYSIDGVSRPVTCTTVIGSLNRYVAPVYSAKTISVPVDPAGTVATWNAADFGGTAGAGILGSAWTTVTCNLPPQTAIGLLYALYNPNLTP